MPSYVCAVTPRGPVWGSGPSWAFTANTRIDVFLTHQGAEADFSQQHSPVASHMGSGSHGAGADPSLVWQGELDVCTLHMVACSLVKADGGKDIHGEEEMVRVAELGLVKLKTEMGEVLEEKNHKMIKLLLYGLFAR